MLTFSIVINTLNRGPTLQKTLESFRWLKYAGDFEVIVVNGPSTDDTDEVISRWLPHIRVGKCDVANLSVSRNIGICMARGDIVAFIDDDAIPEPEWLTQLAAEYDDPMVGGAGGLVYDHTGYEFQYRYCIVDRFGNADHSLPGPTPHLSFPKSERFPHLLGANSSFRRSALLEVGGFDEEYEYFLDETDVCLRIVDVGYIIAQSSGAYVHHRYAPSNIRDHNKIVRYHYPITKNKIYFTLKHAREFYSLERILQEQQNLIQQQRSGVTWAVDEGLIPASDITVFEKDVERALEVGVQRGFEGARPDDMITASKLQRYAGEFKAFKPIAAENSKVVVLVSNDYPPNHNGGIATFNKDLAEALAAQGNIVHVITRSDDINHVDFEHGVWVHHMVPQGVTKTDEAIKLNIPQHIWDWSATALKEAKRIAEHHPIDVVEAPIWDCEGIAFLLDKQWPLVVSLQTTLHFWLQSHPEYQTNKQWLSTLGNPILNLERELMTKASAIRAISQAIANVIEKAYQFSFDTKTTNVVPLGLTSSLLKKQKIAQTSDRELEILFVGRLEPRKGIDILLNAIPHVLQKAPRTRVRIIGDDIKMKTTGKSHKEHFLSSHTGKQWVEQVTFEGRVDDETLQAAYASCDIFVAPSRFESFGLVFLEAMRQAKPVIGCLAGGMPEIISHGVNGLLVQPGEAEELAKAMLHLLESPALRAEMGNTGNRIFHEKFTADTMATASISLYESAQQNFMDCVNEN
jgi:glycogen(starch) synthase